MSPDDVLGLPDRSHPWLSLTGDSDGDDKFSDAMGDSDWAVPLMECSGPGLAVQAEVALMKVLSDGDTLELLFRMVLPGMVGMALRLWSGGDNTTSHAYCTGLGGTGGAVRQLAHERCGTCLLCALELVLPQRAVISIGARAGRKGGTLAHDLYLRAHRGAHWVHSPSTMAAVEAGTPPAILRCGKASLKEQSASET